MAQTSRSLEVGIIANPEVTPVIINAVRKTPKTDNPDLPLTQPNVDPTSINNFNTDLKSSAPKNTLLYAGGAALLAAGIYFATKKK